MSLASRAVSCGRGDLGGPDRSHLDLSALSPVSHAVSQRPVYKSVYRTSYWCEFPHPSRPAATVILGAPHGSAGQHRLRSCQTLSRGTLAAARPAPGTGHAVVIPGPSPEPDCCGTLRQAGSVQGRRSRSRSDAAGALDRFRLAWTPLRRVRGRPPAFPPRMPSYASPIFTSCTISLGRPTHRSVARFRTAPVVMRPQTKPLRSFPGRPAPS
jgi:hypothetical protein